MARVPRSNRYSEIGVAELAHGLDIDGPANWCYRRFSVVADEQAIMKPVVFPSSSCAHP